MLSIRLSWNCGATDNESPKKPFPTNLPMRGRGMPSLPRSKGRKYFQSLGSKACRTRLFWTPPIAACRREKVKKYRRFQTTREGNSLYASAIVWRWKLGLFGKLLANKKRPGSKESRDA